jgi:hypothetical protein
MLAMIAQFVGIFVIAWCAVMGLGLLYLWSIGLFDWD